jgi:hypothetical protein
MELPQLTRNEFSHLANILLHYIQMDNALEQTEFIETGEVVTTQQVLAKVATGSLCQPGDFIAAISSTPTDTGT